MTSHMCDLRPPDTGDPFYPVRFCFAVPSFESCVLTGTRVDVWNIRKILSFSAGFCCNVECAFQPQAVQTCADSVGSTRDHHSYSQPGQVAEVGAGPVAPPWCTPERHVSHSQTPHVRVATCLSPAAPLSGLPQEERRHRIAPMKDCACVRARVSGAWLLENLETRLLHRTVRSTGMKDE